MRGVVVLVHSPLVGPSIWSLVAAELRGGGVKVSVPRLEESGEEAAPYWRQHRDAAVAQVSGVGGESVVLVGHSGAGPLLPAIGEALDTPVGGYVFVDASIPEDGASRLGLLKRELPEAADQLVELLARGWRFPTWGDEDLREEIPDRELRRQVLEELAPRARDFWEEPIPVFEGWPDAPCSYLQFSPSYEVAATEARRRGWSCRRLEGGHFHMLVEPSAVAEAILPAA
jgi:Alpha/beta hydrolase family